MIVTADKGFECQPFRPNEDWTGEALYVVPDGSELAQKIAKLYPNFDFVTDSAGNLTDVVAATPPPEPTPTPPELRENAYNTLPLVPWPDEDAMLTVTEAATQWCYYAAEGSAKAARLAELIAAAKAEVRGMYPDG